MSDVWLAYFYQATGLTQDGWRPRRTVTCDERGCITSPQDYHTLIAEHWTYIGYHELGKEPANVWRAARA